MGCTCILQPCPNLGERTTSHKNVRQTYPQEPQALASTTGRDTRDAWSIAILQENDLVLPAAARFSRQLSFFSFLAAAISGLAFALLSCFFFFFSESVSLSAMIFPPPLGMVSSKGEARKGSKEQSCTML